MQSEGVRVVATSSIAPIGAQLSDIPSFAQKLGVQIVFEGSVRVEGSRVRVTSRMISADGFQLWSQRFDAETDASSMFTVQEQFASALVNRVRPQQSIIRKSEASAGPAILSIYPLLLKAEALLEEGNEPDVRSALARFQEIAQLTRDFARPHCGIAQCYCWLAAHGASQDFDMVAHARSAAERAIELDPEMSRALALRGSCLALQWDWIEAENALRQSMNLSFHASSARQYAMFLTIMGRFDEAWPCIQKAQQIDPFSYLQKVACAKFLYFSRRYHEALDLYSEPLRFGALPLEASYYIALIHIQLGQFNDAGMLARRILRSGGAQTLVRTWVAEIFARCGNAPSGAADEFDRLSSQATLSRYRQALQSLASGDTQTALAAISTALEQREAELPWMAVDPTFDLIRREPRFSEILDKVSSGSLTALSQHLDMTVL